VVPVTVLLLVVIATCGTRYEDIQSMFVKLISFITHIAVLVVVVVVVVVVVAVVVPLYRPTVQIDQNDSYESPFLVLVLLLLLLFIVVVPVVVPVVVSVVDCVPSLGLGSTYPTTCGGNGNGGGRRV
jgi:hypothetical protein